MYVAVFVVVPSSFGTFCCQIYVGAGAATGAAAAAAAAAPEETTMVVMLGSGSGPVLVLGDDWPCSWLFSGSLGNAWRSLSWLSESEAFRFT